MRVRPLVWTLVGFLTVFAFVSVSPLHAQFTEGSIVGTVTDVSGAAVDGAKITVTNVGTAVSTDVQTDSIGFFRAMHLSPGTYEVRVEKSGFKATILKDVAVNVNDVTRADASLQVGSVTESITVSEATPLVQLDEARLASTIETREVQNLPLNGRQIYQLVLLEPGVTASNAPVISNVPSPTSSVTFDFGYIANGSTPRGNNFILDGNSNNNEWLGGTPLIYPSLDAVQQVQVQTLNFSPEYGRNNGTIVNVVTKSGTNNFHGTAFYSGRNTALNARNFFDPPDEKATWHQNQFGGSLGGPIIKDKTFFFTDYEGSRLDAGVPAVITTENPNYRDALIAANPTSLGSMFFQDFPGPNCTGGNPDASIHTCNANAALIEPNRADQYLVRLDENFTPRDQFYARWVNTLASGDVASQELLGAGYRGFTAPFSGFFADLGLGYTHTFSSNTLNDLRFAYSRNNSQIRFGIPSDTTTAGILQAAGLPADSFGDLSFDDGVIPMGGEYFVPRKLVFNTFAVTDTLTHIIGRHSLKFGFEVRRIQENSNYELNSHPFYEFDNITDFDFDAPYLTAATVNRNAPCPGPSCGQFTTTPRNFRWTQWAGFVGDDWKVTPRLSLNLGVRYSIFGSPTETHGILSNIMLGQGGDFYPTQIANATVGRVSQLWKTDYNNFAPRIGVAWDPTGKGTAAIRAGFSVAYEEPYSNLYTNASRLDPPDASTMFVEPFLAIGTQTSYTFPFVPTPDFAGGISPNGGVLPISPLASPPTTTPSGVFPNLEMAYSEQWFLGVQYQFLRNYGFSINYVGTRGVGGYTREDYNRFDGDICNVDNCNFFASRLAPGWGQITYISNESQATYNGMNVQLKKNYSNNFMLIANYTYGKVLDNVTEGGLGDYFNTSGAGLLYSGVQDIENIPGNRGPSEFDIRNRFTLSGIWDLPSPKGDGVLNKIAGGWQLNGIIALQSGRPFDVYCGLAWFNGCDFNMDDLAYDRPNRPAGLKTSGFSEQSFVNGVFGDPTLTFYDGFSRTSAASQVFCPNGMNSILDFGPGFQCLTVGTNGNLSRNAFTGPAYQSVDFAIFKNTMVHERLNIQFRTEIFNLFNHTNLYNPVGDMGSPQFGKSTAAFSPRQIQFGLKLIF